MGETKSGRTGIVAVGGTIDFGVLDEPSQTHAVLIKAVQGTLDALLNADFEDRISCFSEHLPEVARRLKDLHLAIDFLRRPKSRGHLPAGSDAFQLEVAVNARALSLFLSFQPDSLTLADWISLSRSLSQLDLAFRDFLDGVGDHG